jgi:hypothetical protein
MTIKAIPVLLIVASVFMVCAARSAHPADRTLSVSFRTLEAPGIAVHFENPRDEGAREVLRLYPSVKDQLARALQLRQEFQPEVFLIRDHETFTMMTGSDIVVAFADPTRQAIVIDYSRIAAHPINLGPILKHEFCHLLLHAHVRSDLPTWFDEGVCQWVTGGVEEIFTGESRPVLWETAAAGRLLSLQSLSIRFPEDKYGKVLAYEESKNIIEYTDKKYGAESVVRIVKLLGEGKSMDDAIRDTLGVTMAELETNWAMHLSKKFILVVYLTNNIYEILFFIASMATVAGAVKIVIRRMGRRRLEEKEEEDE